MKKSLFLSTLVLTLSFAFTSCQKEEVAPAPAPVAPVVTPITEVTTAFLIGGTPNGYVSVGGTMFGTNMYGCSGMAPNAQNRFSFTVGQTYRLYAIKIVGTTNTNIWEGDVVFDSSGNMTTSNITLNTATCSFTTCGTWGETAIAFLL